MAVSAEAFVIAELVEEGTPKKALQAGIGEEDFELYDEEFKWLVRRANQRKPINARLFKKKFTDFEFVRTGEKITDLIDELKRERAYITTHAAIDEVLHNMEHENVLDQVMFLRDRLGEILRTQQVTQDVALKGDWREHMKEMKRLNVLREAGEVPGIPTGLRNLDHHLGGLVPGRVLGVLGRPGDAKSSLIAKFGVSAMLDGRTGGLFSPEMNEFEHRCRMHTMLSAEKKIQKALGIRNAFRNRALMDGTGFNIKTYKRFLEYLDEEIKGELHLFTQKWRFQKMSLSYIETRIEELGLEYIIIDPIYKLKSPRKRALKHEELADVIDGAQMIAQAYNIPVIVTNQAHRQASAKEAPGQEASFGFDAMAHEVSHMIGVKYFEDEQRLQLRCSKNRFGQGKFKIDVNFRPNVGIFEDITPIKMDYHNGHEPAMDGEVRKLLDDAGVEAESTYGK